MLPLRRAPPVTTCPSFGLHLVKNVGFLLASLVFLPLSATICAYAMIFNFKQKEKQDEPLGQRKKLTVMVSGVRATKGLTLAREFARAGHRVVAVEEASQWSSSARFSSCISTFHLLPDPLASQEDYTAALVRIALAERVDLYVPACGVATTICDGIAKSELEAVGVQVLQFDATLGKRLDKKDLFMEMCQGLGLQVPLTTLVRSVDEAMSFDFEGKGKGKRFLMKCVGVDDRTRNDMTLFPLSDRKAMKKRFEELGISEKNQYILQEFISGTEYLSQSLVANGKVITYCCCESSDLLVNYVSLPPDMNLIAASALAFTQRFVEAHSMTGQIAFDFIRSDLDGELYAIECNPRTHTAIVLFRDYPSHPSSAGQSEWVNAYTSTISSSSVDAFLARQNGKPLVPIAGTPPAYWIGHEIFDAFRFRDIKTLIHRLLFEFDAHWDTRDPVPWFALYHIQWPAVFLFSMFSGKKWTRINASTGKVFWC